MNGDPEWESESECYRFAVSVIVAAVIVFGVVIIAMLAAT